MVVLIDFMIGVIYGGVVGYKGGRIDSIMMWIIEVLYGLLYFFVVILLMVLMGLGLGIIIVVLIVIGWVGMVRIVRGQVFQIKNYEYVFVLKIFGVKIFCIIWKNLLLNIMGVIIV